MSVIEKITSFFSPHTSSLTPYESHLPDEIMCGILQYLPLADQAGSSLISKQFYHISKKAQLLYREQLDQTLLKIQTHLKEGFARRIKDPSYFLENPIPYNPDISPPNQAQFIRITLNESGFKEEVIKKTDVEMNEIPLQNATFLIKESINSHTYAVFGATYTSLSIKHCSKTATLGERWIARRIRGTTAYHFPSD